MNKLKYILKVGLYMIWDNIMLRRFYEVVAMEYISMKWLFYELVALKYIVVGITKGRKNDLLCKPLHERSN